MNGLTEGRIVHYSGDSPDKMTHCQAAIVVRVFDKTSDTGCANLTVFTDWQNDNQDNLVWATSRLYAKALGAYKWHWPQECPRS